MFQVAALQNPRKPERWLDAIKQSSRHFEINDASKTIFILEESARGSSSIFSTVAMISSRTSPGNSLWLPLTGAVPLSPDYPLEPLEPLAMASVPQGRGGFLSSDPGSAVGGSIWGNGPFMNMDLVVGPPMHSSLHNSMQPNLPNGGHALASLQVTMPPPAPTNGFLGAMGAGLPPVPTGDIRNWRPCDVRDMFESCGFNSNGIMVSCFCEVEERGGKE